MLLILSRVHSKCPKIVQLAIREISEEFDWRFHFLNESEQLFSMAPNPFQFNVDLII